MSPRSVAPFLAAIAALLAPSPVAALQPGDILVADNALGICGIDATTHAVQLLIPTRGIGGTQLVAPLAIATGGGGELYVLDDSNPRTVWRFDMGSGIGTPVAGCAGLARPSSMAVATDGTIYISDTEAGSDHGAVFRITAGGAQSVLTTGGHPGGVAVDPAGNVYVGRMDRQELQMYSPDGAPVWTAPTPGFATYLMAMGAGNRIYLFGWNDAVGGDSYRFDPASRTLTHFGPVGPVALPYGAAVLPDGDVVIAAYAQQSVMSFHPDGSLAWTLPAGPGSFRIPFGVAIHGARDGALPAIPATWGGVKGRYHH